MNSIRAILLTLFLSSVAFTQRDSTGVNHAIYVELFGNARNILSLNYEKRIWKHENRPFSLHIRAGGSHDRYSYDSTRLYILLTELNCLKGRGEHRIEAGLGAVYFIGTSPLTSPNIPDYDRTNHHYFFTLRLGYRNIQPEGFVARVAPILFVYRDSYYNCWKLTWLLGFSMGYHF